MPRMVSLQIMIKQTVCVAKEGGRETKKTGIGDILVDYCHDWKCFQDYFKIHEIICIGVSLIT